MGPNDIHHRVGLSDAALHKRFEEFAVIRPATPTSKCFAKDADLVDYYSHGPTLVMRHSKKKEGGLEHKLLQTSIACGLEHQDVQPALQGAAKLASLGNDRPLSVFFTALAKHRALP
jgi:hypothetical protein